VRLENLVTCQYSVFGDPKKEITGVTYDSRAVRSGFVFVAVRGEKSDGHDYIETAIARGAAAIVCEKGHPGFSQLSATHRSVAWIGVSDCRDALAAISAAFYDRPSGKLGVVGITGTNGKTSVSYILKSILEKWDKKVGLVGTIKYMIGSEMFDAPHTTPEASDFQSLLGGMVEKGCDYAVSEVSSHALSQKRVDYTQFKVAIFTNLTGDHLDYHGTMENYFESKLRLFTGLLDEKGTAVINIDDPFGSRLSSMLAEKRPSVAQIKVSLRDSSADISSEDIKYSFRGTHFIIRLKEGGPGMKISSQLVGETGIYNVMSAVSAALALGVPHSAICEGVAALQIVKGRFECVDCGQPFLAIVDYAHTHDALQRLLGSCRRLLGSQSASAKKAAGAKKIITVFGCGGNRDKKKRPLMGGIAADMSDFVIITSDNPRNEDPTSIIRDIEAGIGKDNYIVIQDRSIAIRMATLLASPGDIVIIAGKGHEDYQEIMGRRYPFSDSKALEGSIVDLSRMTKRARAGKVMFGTAVC
jgi:UDP-N-acetylmuramoyl-L-alanyl-D-glutamate--2,6-diaminopimelate ligase